MAKILITADIHFETLEMDKLELYKEYFKNSIETFKPDIFCIAGDLVDDRNLKAESNEFKSLIDFTNYISRLCINNNIYMVVLRGTVSHDGDVVETVANICKGSNNGFEYINDICVRTIKGLDILFIPEPYYAKYNDFYEELVNKRGNKEVDCTIFHGMVDFAIPQLKQIDSKYNLSRSIVIKSSDLKHNNKTIVIGGHVHSYIYKDNIYYTQRFINERGHYSDLDNYGLKLVTIENDNYKIMNIPNPYIIKQNLVRFDLVSGVNAFALQPLINVYKDQNQDDYVYIFKYDPHNIKHRELIKEFQLQTGAKYIKREKININSDDTVELIKINDKKHVEDILIEVYNSRYNDIPLTKEHIEKIKGDE